MAVLPFRFPRLITLIIGVALGFGVLFLSARFARSQDYMLNRDFFMFWLAGRMLSIGEDPYNAEQWIANHNQFGAEHLSYHAFAYPYPLAVIFAPLGLTSLRNAAIVWVFFTLIMILASIYLLLRIWRGAPPWSYILPVLAGVFLFRPIFGILVWGQLDGLLLITLALIAYLWEKGKWLEGSLLLPVLLLKPQLGFLIVSLASIWLLIQRKWVALFAEGILTVAIVGVSLVMDPTWIQRWMAAIESKWTTILDYPSVWGLSSWLCKYHQTCYISAGAIISGLLILACIYVWIYVRNIRPAVMLAITVCIALLITPYVQIYDHILIIIPVLLAMDIMRSEGVPYLITAPMFLGISVLAFLLAFVYAGIGLDVWSVSIPGLVLLILCVEYFRSEPRREIT